MLLKYLIGLTFDAVIFQLAELNAGQRGNVVNGKLVNREKTQKCRVLALNKKVLIQNISDYEQ
jgi:hypothetical protein